MAVDYDLVVIGNSAAGVQAAIAARQHQARVALVSQAGSAALLPEQCHRHTLLELGRVETSLQQLAQTDLWRLNSLFQAAAVPPWLEETVRLTEEMRSPAALASLGIDVLAGSGQFCGQPTVGFQSGGRCLTARAYLIATGSRSHIPAIPGLASIPYWTPERLLNHPPNLAQFRHWIILGGTAVAIELAQVIQRLGGQVTLIVAAPQVLSLAEAETSYRIQAQLEAEGVDVRTSVSVTQVRSLEGKLWLQVGYQALEADDLLIATEQAPNVESLNLAAVSVAWSEVGILCDRHYQAAPRIYVCEGRLGRDCFSHLAVQEALWVVHNLMTFWPPARSQLRPWVLFTEPEVAQVGLTLTDALQRYGKRVLVLQRSLKAQMQQSIDSHCQLIVHRNGHLLGATVVGNQASELIGTIALAMQERMSIAAFVRLPVPSPTWLELLHQVAMDWHTHCPAWQKELRESWLTMRRSWVK